MLDELLHAASCVISNQHAAASVTKELWAGGEAHPKVGPSNYNPQTNNVLPSCY
jgi:hypothetical protein